MIDALSAATVSNPNKVRQTRELVNKNKSADARSAMQRIDAVLAEEMQLIRNLASGFSEGRKLIEGTEKRHARQRSLYQRQADLNIEFLNQLAAMLTFLSSRSETYKVGDSGVIFRSTQDADQYNVEISKLQAIVAKQEQLDKDVQAEQQLTSSASVIEKLGEAQ